MSTTKAAREALEQAVTTFKFCKTALTNAVDTAALTSERTLNSKMQRLDNALVELNAAHTAWVLKEQPSDEDLQADKYSTAWLESVWKDYDSLQDKFDVKLTSVTAGSGPPVQSNDSKLNIFVKQMDTLKSEIKTKTDTLSSKLSGPITAASYKVYVEMLSSIKDHLSNQFVELTNSIISLDAAQIDELEEFRKGHLSSIVNIELTLAEKNPSSTSPPLPTVNTRGVEMEKIKAPTFSGQTLDYPEFKRGWEKVAGVCWDDANQLEHIKQKVDSNTRRIITRCKSMTEVWAALDTEYAQEQEVVNAVNKELSDLRSSNCTTEEYIVKLRNHLPNLEDVLMEVNGLEHLQSPERVNFIVDKFDERTLHEWEYFRSKNEGTTYKRFFAFLVDRYDASRSAIARQCSRLQQMSINLTTVCTECNLVGHSAPECTPAHQVNSTSASAGGGCHRCDKWTARDAIYTCPGCGRGTPKGQKISHCLEHCGAYMSMSVNERSDCIEKSSWCPIHLLGSHQYTDCNKKADPQFLCGIGGCQKHHHKSLHSSTTPFVVKINSTSLYSAANTLTLIQTIAAISGSLTSSLISLWDNGSTCSLITKSAAQRLNLIGEPVCISIETAIGTTVIDSFLYRLPLVDTLGNIHHVNVYAVENISNILRSVDISKVKNIFSQEVQDKWRLLERATGEIELLLGLNVFALHPRELECSGNLKVMSSQFGSGYLLGGCHADIVSDSIEWSETVSNIRLAKHTINKISVQPAYEFFQGDIMGIQPPRRCGNCMKCKECTFIGQQMSQREQYEYRIIESKVIYDTNQGCFHVQYPFTEDPRVLSSNRAQVTRIEEREEKKLIKADLLDFFNNEFDKMIDNGAVVEIPEEEQEEWDGPVHYVPIQHVVREDSSSTPMRIVTNSSLSDKRGISLNSILMKGPNTLSDQWEILNKWRQYETALCTDITKAYWSFRTGAVEKHVRRIVWRHGDPTQPWKVYGFCVVSFGDRPAAAILEIAVKKTAEMNRSIDPLAADKIASDRYVDDIATGGTSAQVSRFVGNKSDDGDEPDSGNKGTIEQILSRGGLRLKAIVTSGETNEEKIQKLGKAVLGIGWNAPSDTTNFDFTQFFQQFSLAALITFTFTLRICLSVINSIYDPLGLLAPVTVRFKIAFRDLFRTGLNLSWDDLIPQEDQEHWRVLLQMVLAAEPINFRRSTKPPNAIGNCQLICFFDGSDHAYASVIYIRWKLQDGSIHTTLVNCKSRTTPIQRISTPRSELNGAVIASRLVLSTLKSWSSSEDLPERVWIIGDSECTLSSIEKVSAAFGEFFGNRIGEIQDNQAKIEE